MEKFDDEEYGVGVSLDSEQPVTVWVYIGDDCHELLPETFDALYGQMQKAHNALNTPCSS